MSRWLYQLSYGPAIFFVKVYIRACLDIPKYTPCQYYFAFFAARFFDLYFTFFNTGASITSDISINVSIKSTGAFSPSTKELNRSLMPKRIRKTFSSRGVSVDNIFRVCSAKSILIVASEGDIIFLSSIKSPRWLSSSSPIGVSREIGSLAIFRYFSDFLQRIFHFIGNFFGSGLTT